MALSYRFFDQIALLETRRMLANRSRLVEMVCKEDEWLHIMKLPIIFLRCAV
jgi:hypothetical protein